MTQIENQKYKYFIYCRKSNGNEKDSAPSINAQYDELVSYAERQGLNIVDTYKEVQSAFETGRPKFAEMLERINDGDANGILIWEVSRLSRNMQDGATIDTLKTKKKLLSIRTPSKEYIDEDGEDFLYSMELVISRQYSKEISKRVRRGLKHKVMNGEWPGGAPLGYVNFSKNKTLTGYMTPERRELERIILDKCQNEHREVRRTELHPIKGPMLKIIFEDFATGNYSIEKIQDKMNELGIMGKDGKPVGHHCIVNMFQNPFYYGVINFGANSALGNHEAIITKSLYDKVQEAFKIRNKPLKRKKGLFEFTGLIKCAECGCGITGYNKTKNNKFKGKTTYTYYGCTHMRDRMRRIKCSQSAMSGKELKKQLEKEVRKIELDDMTKELITEAIKQSHQKEKEIHNKGILEWQTMYNTAETRLNKLFELYYNGAINQSEFSSRKEALLSDKQKAKEHLETHSQAQKAWLEYSEKLIVTTDQVYKIFKQGTPEEVRLLMTTIGKNYYLQDHEVTFVFKEPFNMIARLSEHRSSNKNDWRGQGDLNPRSPP